MADTNWGEGYRGGYGGGVSLQDIEGGIRDATSTFINYVSGTVQLVFMIAFVFMFISILTLCLMIYARYSRSAALLRPNSTHKWQFN